jgi:hypothetical protein
MVEIEGEENPPLSPTCSASCSPPRTTADTRPDVITGDPRRGRPLSGARGWPSGLCPRGGRRLVRLTGGPRRAPTAGLHLRHPRAIPIVALAAFVGGAASVVTSGAFWARHTLLASLAGSLIVVMVSVAVINELLERRRRRRWNILAQYVMFELIRNARMIWTGVLDVAALSLTGTDEQASVDRGAEIVRDTHVD